MMNQSLFIVGEIGGNDYNLPLLERVPFENVLTFAPAVNAKISSSITVSSICFPYPSYIITNIVQIAVQMHPIFSGVDQARSQDSGGSRESPDWMHPSVSVGIPE